MSTPPAGWYTDPQDQASERWWDGTQWTATARLRAIPPPQPPPPMSAPILHNRAWEAAQHAASPFDHGTEPDTNSAQADQWPSAYKSSAGAPMGLVQTAKKTYTTLSFSGRSSRSEFWYTALVTSLTCFVISVLQTSLLPSGKASLVTILFWIATMLIQLAATVRRYHDVNKSGLWLFAILGVPAVASGVMVFAAATALVAALNGQERSDPPASLMIAAAVSGLLALAAGVVHLVWLCSKPSPERNRFNV
jgi:uncharacterized membrane protein YhaH (DUF805 family)